MQDRPKIKIPLSPTDKLLEIAGWLLIPIIWGWAIINYSELPDTIPTHYNAAGQADGFGAKQTIFLLPFISTILYGLLSLLNRFPHVFNYPVTITENNALHQYTNATRMIRWLKFIIAFVFGLIVYKTIQNAQEQKSGLEIWLLPVTLGLIFIPVIYFVVRSFRLK